MPIWRMMFLRLFVASIALSALASESPAQVLNQHPGQPNRAAERPTGPIRVAQYGAHGRYPAGQVLGGYRNPYAYPYYRYTPRRYPFGVGPYGPYGSNYGGYSGNAYDPGVTGGRRLPIAPAAPPAPPDGTGPLPQTDPGPAPPVLSQPVPNGPALPVPNANRGYGDPAPYYGGPMYNPTYGPSQFLGMYPYGYRLNEMWYGHNGRVQGFAAYPALDYPYVYGPPSGFGYYSQECAPQYDNDRPRNFGPSYPAVGGINGGVGFGPDWLRRSEFVGGHQAGIEE